MRSNWLLLDSLTVVALSSLLNRAFKVAVSFAFFRRLVLIALPFVAYAQVPSADLFVSPKGNDVWTGTASTPNTAHTDGPFASVARAQVAVRQLLKSNPGRPVTVMLRAGTYYLPLSPTRPGTLEFTASDSGGTTGPVIWRSYPGETPVISGGEPLGTGGLGRSWMHVSGSLWQVRLPAATLPFESLFYNGQRRLRSRVAAPSGMGYFMRGGSCYSTETKKTVGLSQCNLGTFLRIAAEVPAKGANAGCPAIAKTSRPSLAKCLDRFVYDAKDPLGNWINLNPSDTACPAAPDGSPAKSYPAGDIELTLFNTRTVDVLRVSCVDPVRHMIYFIAKARGDSDNYDSYGPVAGHRYIVENSRDAFDAANREGQTGVWFLDRSTSPWTLNYLAQSGENPDRDEVVIPQVQPVTSTGGSLIAALYLDYVTFSGIAFEVDNFVPPASGFNNDEVSGDTLPEAIDCISCKHVTFDGVTVRHTSASGVRFTSASGDIERVPTDLRIVNSAFYDIGDSGIRIGSHPRVGDRWNHVVQYVSVENNIVQGYSRVFAGGAGIAEANGHDITYLHNDITDGYQSGLSVCLMGCGAHDANGYSILAQYNHIWNVMQGITSDGGAIYFNVGDRAGTGANNKILNNLVHDVSDSASIDQGVAGYGYGGYGIFLDNQSAAVDVGNNVVLRVSDASLAMTLGPPKGATENVFRNNILAFARRSLFTFPAATCMETPPPVRLVNNIFQFDRNSTAGFQMLQGCSLPCQSFEGNIYWRTGGGSGSIPERCAATAVNPGFGKTNSLNDYLLSKNPVAGFDSAKTNDTIRNAGRNHPVIVPPKIPATFPTFPFEEF